MRYNRLIDIFLGVTAYSLQNHLRTTVKGLGQIEIDEVYIGVDRMGCQYVIPLQAKGGSDQLSTVQAKQGIARSLFLRPKSTTHFTVRQTLSQLVWKQAAVSFQLMRLAQVARKWR